MSQQLAEEQSTEHLENETTAEGEAPEAAEAATIPDQDKPEAPAEG